MQATYTAPVSITDEIAQLKAENTGLIAANRLRKLQRAEAAAYHAWKDTPTWDESIRLERFGQFCAASDHRAFYGDGLPL